MLRFRFAFRHKTRNALFLAAAIAFSGTFSEVLARVWDMDQLLESRGVAKQSASAVTSAIQEALAMARSGDALILPSGVPLGKISIGNSASDIEIHGGFDGEIHVLGSIRDWKFILCGENTSFHAHKGSNLDGCRFFCSFSGEKFVDESGSRYEAIGLGIVPSLKNGSLAKAAADPTHNGGTTLKWGAGAYKIDPFNSTVWMPAYYVSGGTLSTPQVDLRNGSGGKWLFAIEAEQGTSVLALKMTGCKNAQLYSGSTEGCNNQSGPIYDLDNCENVVLGMRRFYSNHKTSGWGGAPVLSLSVKGGKNNVIHNLVDIGNPKSKSIISSDPSLQIWQTFFEDDATLAAGTFQYAVTHQGMTTDRNAWTEPVMVGSEIILQRGSESLFNKANSNLPVPPAFDKQPGSGVAKALDPAGVQKVERRYRLKAGFGAALLAAGADPTGKRFSDAAFRTIVASGTALEIPAGTYRLKEPLALRAAGASLSKTAPQQVTGPGLVVGAGPGKTVIVAENDVEAVIDIGNVGGFARTGATHDMVAIEGITVLGGKTGIRIQPRNMSTIISDFEIRGAGKAAVTYASAWFESPCAEGVACGSDQHCNDMHVFENGTISGYDYGVYYPCFSDKQGFKNITFSGQKIAGISSVKSNLFHGWIGSCNFTNISGPGIDLSGGGLMPPAYGNAYYTQWVTMIENCTFTECGSATRAALDYGLTDINMFCNSSITTKNKQIKYGFLGSLAEMSHVTIDVNASGAALALRHPRQTEGSRTPGMIIHTVTCNGKMMFINDVPSGDGTPNTDPVKDCVFTSRLAGVWDGSAHSGPKWWKGGYAWAFPRLFYNSTINGKKYGYVLTNSYGFSKELTTGASFDLSDVTQVGKLAGTVGYTVPLQSLKSGRTMSYQVFDLHGRLVGSAMGNYKESVLGLKGPRGLRGSGAGICIMRSKE